MQTVSRLINTFKPEHYELSLWLDRKNRAFRGKVTISGAIPKNTPEIRLHAKELSIESVSFNGKPARFTPDDNDELIISHADIAEGDHVVAVEFSGEITDAMHGLYPCYYEHDGVKKELLATQFESHHAREVFPCVDEPEAKASFDLTLYTEKDIVVLGNMPVESQTTEGDQLVTTFETSPRMSTYLLAFVAGELHKKSARTKTGTEVNVWATPAQAPESLEFALDIATRTIDFFNEYFDTPYPLPKSDHVALPDFSSGAMENWGLVTYREIALLADPKTTSISSKQYIATVITHELSHMWFGNLVTMKWWDNLWLNESFATLMEYVAVDALHPEWNIWLEFSSHESLLALRRDAIDGVQPVQTDVNHPDEISTLFDGAIVYAKGARLLRMLQNYLGHEAFQAGLRRYFNTHAYQNTEAADLWYALDEASGKNVTSLMNTWLSQSGYPVVHASRSTAGQVNLKQEQFFVGPHNESDKKWPIPLNSNSATLPELFSSHEITIDNVAESPLRLNINDTAHFITKYDSGLLGEILAAIKRGELSAIDRLQLLHEQSMLARGGYTSSANLIPLLLSYQNETDEAVWGIISATIGELKKFVESDDASETKLRQLAASLAKSQYTRLGWNETPGEPESDTKLRATVIGLMLYGQDKEAVEKAVDYYKSTDINQLPGEFRPSIISAYVRHAGDSEAVKALFDIYKSTPSAELQTDIAIGITASENTADIEHSLSMLTNSSVVRPQDLARWFIYLLRNRRSRDATWQWMVRHWNWIKDAFDGDKSFDDYPRYSANVFSDRKHLEAYREFFEPKKSERALTRTIEVGLSEVIGRVELVERDTPLVQKYLLEN